MRNTKVKEYIINKKEKNKKARLKIKERGITLIALVVTIVILLILASVTLGMVFSHNGILKMSKKAVTEYKVSSEREYLEQNVLSIQLDKYMENVSSKKLGKSLVDRSLENSSIWDIIVEKSGNKTYGTGWNYVEKGTEIEGYGKTKNSWVVNYRTGEIIQLEDEGYNNFDYKSTVAVTEGLLFNLDSSNVGLNKESWGNNTTLYYYDEKKYDTVEKRIAEYEKQKEYESVLKNNEGYDRQKSDKIEEYIDEKTGAFKFNGNNYIEIYNENGFDFSQGFTFEFYGNITDGRSSTISESLNVCPLINLWDGNFSNDPISKFNFDTKNTDYFWFTLVADMNTDSSWTDPNAKCNQFFKIDDFLNKDIYLTLIFEPNKSERTIEKLYLNGVFLGQTDISKECYEQFIKKCYSLNYIEFGRGDITLYRREVDWNYAVSLCYASRIYNKNLSTEEVQLNYNKTTAFHKYIVDSKDK